MARRNKRKERNYLNNKISLNKNALRKNCTNKLWHEEIKEKKEII